MKDFTTEFQTPPEVCRYMASLLDGYKGIYNVLEPTKGIGNIVTALENKGYNVHAPDDYFLLEKKRMFDAVVMNPPFSVKSAIIDNAPTNFLADGKGMKFGYKMLLECMEKSDIIIALMPWFTLSDSDVRIRYLKKFGIKSLTHLPRKTFEYARIQTVIIELHRGYEEETIYRLYDHEPKIKSELEKTQLTLI